MLIKNDNEIVFRSFPSNEVSAQHTRNWLQCWLALAWCVRVCVFFRFRCMKPKNGFYAINVAKHVFHISHTRLGADRQFALHITRDACRFIDAYFFLRKMWRSVWLVHFDSAAVLLPLHWTIKPTNTHQKHLHTHTNAHDEETQSYNKVTGWFTSESLSSNVLNAERNKSIVMRKIRNYKFVSIYTFS